MSRGEAVEALAAVRDVFIVSSGIYSDYAVHCAFDSEALAQGYIDAVRVAAKAAETEEWGAIDTSELRVETIQMWSAIPVVIPDPEESDYIYSVRQFIEVAALPSHSEQENG